jgi:hypothetical protein
LKLFMERQVKLIPGLPMNLIFNQNWFIRGNRGWIPDVRLDWKIKEWKIEIWSQKNFPTFLTILS